MQRLGLTLSLVLSVFSTVACSDDPAGDDGGDETGGSSGTSTGGSTTGGSTTGGSTTGGSTTGGSTTGGSSTGGSSGSSTGGAGGAGATGGSATGGAGGSGGSGFTSRGICDQVAQATASTTDYTGTEEFYVLSDEARQDGRVDNPVEADMLCRIRFDVTHSGTAPAGCEDLDGEPCEWTHQVTYGNPEVLKDMDGACARHELHWNQAWIDEMDGSTVTYGYIFEFAGHDSVVLTYSEAMSQWVEIGRAFWDEATNDFNFKVRFGECRY